MESSGHFGFSATVTYALIWAVRRLGISVGWWDGAVVILGSAFLASIPDIDVRLRRAGVRHRGFTHTIWFALILAIPAYAGLQYMAEKGFGLPLSPIAASIAVALAVLTHIAADSLNYQRVRPLEPLSRAGIALHLFRSSNRLANTGFFLLGSGLIAAYFYGAADTVQVAEAALLGSAAVISLSTLVDRLGRKG